MTSDDSWRVENTSPVQRDLQRIPPRYVAAIIEFLTAVLPANPPRLGKPLRSELEGLHSARRGDYRVLYRIDRDSRTAFVVRVDHRSRVYKSR